MREFEVNCSQGYYNLDELSQLFLMNKQTTMIQSTRYRLLGRLYLSQLHLCTL